MHVLVIFIELGCVSLRSKSCKTLFVDVDSQRFVAGHNDIDSEIKFVPIDEEWVCNISGDNRKFIYIQVVYIVYDVDSFTLTGVTWLYNPNIPSGIRLL